MAAAFYLAGTSASWAQGGPITFSVIGDIPYSATQADDFRTYVADHNGMSPAEFFVHVGDIRSQSGACPEADYAQTADIMRPLAVPAFILPGDNEWNDCSDPDAAWVFWEAYFSEFEQQYCGTPAVEAQAVRLENFAFVRERVLFIGLNLVGGSVHDSGEWALRLQQNADWIDQHFVEKGGQVRAAVVFGHAARDGSRSAFWDRFDVAALAFGRPILYIHGDGHSWQYDTGWGVANISRIQIDQGAPPLEVTVTLDPESPFVFERDPWPAGTPDLNRAPCVDAGSDQVVAFGSSAVLDGLVSDDGIPAPPAVGVSWSQASGPAQSVVADPGSTSTTASFPQPGRYVLRLTADDGDLSGSDDVAIYVDSGQPYLWIHDATLIEGSAVSSAVFDVDLLSATGGPVSVDFTTQDETALAGSDYQATSGNLTFSGATTSQSISVPVLGDEDLEPFESFRVLLANPSGAAIADGDATGLILDDDVPRPPVIVSFQPSSGPPGTVVALTGQFNNVSGASVGGVAASFVVLSETELELVVPPTAQTGPIRVSNVAGAGQSLTPFGVEFPLSVDVIGSGSVDLSPPGSVFVQGTSVTLTPVPDAGWEFLVWSGDLAGSNAPVVIQITGPTSVSAAFVEAGSVLRNTWSTPIAADSDDAEEELATGSVNLSSSDLELAVDAGSPQLVGLRFTGVGIPQGAKLLSASLQFTADEKSSGPAELTLRGVAVDAPAPFVNSPGHISGRPSTSASVAWNPPDWTSVGEAGAAQRTPDLSAIVQEIVDRPGWSPGNAMVFLVSGTGTRTAESHNGAPGSAARLEAIEIIDVGAPHAPENLRVEGSSPTHLDLAWDAAYDNLGVTAYRIYRIGGVVELSETSYSDTGLAPDREYGFQVTALDAAGNESRPSATLLARTDPLDQQPPTTPANLRSPAQTETEIELAWEPSTDAVGVVGYRIYRFSGPVDVVATSRIETGLTPDRLYAFQVSALDAAGNESWPTPMLLVRTQTPDREPPSAPQNLRSPAQTETRIDLAWDASTDDVGVVGYRVYGPGAGVDVASTTHSIDGLSPDAEYIVQVSALDAAGNESPPSAVLVVRTRTPDREPPSTPQNLHSPAQTETSIDLSWDASSDDVAVTGYRVYGPAGITEVAGTTHTEAGLQPGREYGCQVTALDAAGHESMPTSMLVARTLTPDREAPTAPQNLRSPLQTETTIELAWDASSDDVGVTGYRVHSPAGSVDVAGTTFAASGLDPDTEYAFQVSARDAAGNESMPSAVLLARTLIPDTERPTTPQNLRSPLQTETRIDLAWDASTDDVGVTGYRIYRPSGPIDVAGTSHTASGLTPDREYAFQVLALDAAGNESLPGPVLAVRTLALDVEPPSVPQNLRSPAQTLTRIDLLWDPSTDNRQVTGYRVYGPGGTVDVPGTGHSWTGLTPDTEYAFQVSAFDAAGNESAPSPTLLARTVTPDDPPTTPGNLHSPQQTQTSVDLAWDPSTDDLGVVGYRVYGPGGTADVPGTSHTWTGLAPDTEYAFQVSALDTGGNESALSPVLLVRTLLPDVTPPTTPQNLRSPLQTETRIDLAWDPSTDDVGVAGYRVYGPGGSVDVPGTTHTWTGLAPDTEYAFQVSAFDAAGNESAQSPALLVRTVKPDEPPSTPGNLHSPAQTETEIELAWDPSTDDVGVVGYRVYGPGGSADVPGTTHTWTGLAPDTEYAFQVSALDTAGNESVLSPVLPVRTLAPDVTPPTTPQNLRSPAQTGISIDLEWDASIDDRQVTGYRVYGPGASVDVPGTSHTWTGLTPDTEYAFQVSAFDAAGNQSALSPVLTVSTPNQVPTAFSVQIATGADDVEENLGSGAVNRTSGDLELAVTGTTAQAVGLRFGGVQIPQGAPIVSASVQFTADEVKSGPVDLTLRAQADDDAAPFATTAGDVSSRPLTSASAAWIPPDWVAIGDAGPAQLTSNLAAVLQEVVDRPGWAFGNALVVVITGTGTRTAESYDGLPAGAARLDVVYLGAPDVQPPSVPGNLRSPSQSRDSIDLEWDASTDDRQVTGYRVYGPSGSVDVPGTSYTETGLAPLTPYDFQVSALDAAGNESGLSPVLSVSTTDTTIESVRIAAGNEDAEENLATGAVNVTSSDLELVDTANTNQVVGLRFSGLGIPQGASIVSASVQFTADEVRSGPVALNLRGEATDDAAVFVTTAGSVSSRPVTSASVAWSPLDWVAIGDAGAAQRTPDLSAILQEIVDRPGWAAGNALVLVVTGTGTRTAESYNGLASGAPLLRVEYRVP